MISDIGKKSDQIVERARAAFLLVPIHPIVRYSTRPSGWVRGRGRTSPLFESFPSISSISSAVVKGGPGKIGIIWSFKAQYCKVFSDIRSIFG